MPTITLDTKTVDDLKEHDWLGNNVAFTCPVCGKVYIVSGFTDGGIRRCPCGRSTGYVAGGRKAGGTARIEWSAHNAAREPRSADASEPRLPTVEELLLRLADSEDHFVERKSAGDSKDWLKTTVAFANSAQVGYPSVLFIGVKNDGTVDPTTNLDTLQKTFAEKISMAYPPISYFTRIVRKDGKEALAVIILGSSERPHFAGPSYVREGSQTKRASEKAFGDLIASRNSNVHALLEWKNRIVLVSVFRGDLRLQGRPLMLVGCNPFYVTLADTADQHKESYAVDRLSISFDHVANTLSLECRL